MLNKVFKNTGVYVIAEIANKSLPFFLLPIITNYIPPKDYGLIAFLNSFIAITFVFTRLGGDGFITVSFLRNKSINISRLVLNVQSNSVISFVLLLIISFLSYLIYPEIFIISFSWIVLALISNVLNSFTQVQLALYQAKEEPLKFGITQFSMALTNFLISLILVVFVKMGWQGRALGILLSYITIGILNSYTILKKGLNNFKRDSNQIKDSLRFGLPLIPHHLNDWLKKGADIIILTGLINSASAGIYNLSFQLSIIINLIAYAFIRAYTPTVYNLINRILAGENHLKYRLVQNSYLFMVGIFVIGIIIILVLPILFEFFFNDSYNDSIRFIPILTMSYVISSFYLVVSVYFFYFKKTGLLSKLTFFTGLFHVIFSYLFISKYGTYGAALTSLISQSLTFVIVFVISNKIFPLPWVKYLTDLVYEK